MDRKTVIIIKHGFSETCDHSVSPIVSFGDVFRCTCLLEDFKDSHVTWITAQSAKDLLEGNHLIDQLILADSPVELPPDAIRNRYDLVINLEKQRDWCQFAAALEAQEHYGFRDWATTGDDAFYPASAAALSAGLQRGDYRPMQETLFATVARQWHGQRYVLGYQPRVTEIYDIGLNHHVGPKWPTKVWPRQHWETLHDQLAPKYAVCWQQSLNSIRHYLDWLASCRLIVTTDSLGLHLALGLNKKVVALFGPTAAQQVYLYGCGAKLTPICDRNCIPCFQPRCDFPETCMEDLPPDLVAEVVDLVMAGKPVPARPVVKRVRTVKTPVVAAIGT